MPNKNPWDRESGSTPKTVLATSDERTVNNVMRHQYRVLSDDEKANMLRSKDLALKIHQDLCQLNSLLLNATNNMHSINTFSDFLKMLNTTNSSSDSIHNAVNRVEEARDGFNKAKAALNAAMISITEAQFWATHAITK